MSYFKIDIYNDKPHNGNPITKMEVSPNEKYLVTYSKEDNSVVGWNVEDVDEGLLKPGSPVKVENYDIHQICVSDYKKLVYIGKYGTIGK